MKVLIDISEKSWNVLKTYIPSRSKEIILPDDATNGDVIRALFPNKEEFNAGDGAYFHAGWWNAPYKIEVE